MTSKKALTNFYPRTTTLQPSSVKNEGQQGGYRVKFNVPTTDPKFGNVLQGVALYALSDKAYIRAVNLYINQRLFATLDSALLQKDVYDTLPLPFLRYQSPLLGYLMTLDTVQVEVIFIPGAPYLVPRLRVEYRRADPYERMKLLNTPKVGPFKMRYSDGRLGELWYEGGHLLWVSRWGHMDDDPVQQLNASYPGFEELSWKQNYW